MSSALLVSSELLIDNLDARATSIAWAVERYPALEIPRFERSLVRHHLRDPLVPDEVVASCLVSEVLGKPSDAVEPALMARLITERAYGGRLYEKVFGHVAHYWRGDAALDEVVGRALEVPQTSALVVLSMRSRVETMTALLSTGWAERVLSVVCADDVVRSSELPEALVCEALRRLEVLMPGTTKVDGQSSWGPFQRALERLVASL